jgi:hypothetical protein
MATFICECCKIPEEADKPRTVMIYGIEYEKHLCVNCYALKQEVFEANKSWYFERYRERERAKYNPTPR